MEKRQSNMIVVLERAGMFTCLFQQRPRTGLKKQRLPVLHVSEDEEDMEKLNYLTQLLAETDLLACCRPTPRTSREQAVRIICCVTLARSGHSAPVAGSHGLDLPPVSHYRGCDCRGGLSCTMEHEEDRQCPACPMAK
ncbi:hypothetical protein DPEC_G00237570 [Dallia pectoralis]|uniref:Uncharacterized protein n=1 Tax=Dallia pectoralis TaxID=75939 RepID=A0ACC2FYP7_DALPE|nr:hypothetical protein DPEC_G00237570 [Dallia pectoralis]